MLEKLSEIDTRHRRQLLLPRKMLCNKRQICLFYQEEFFTGSTYELIMP